MLPTNQAKVLADRQPIRIYFDTEPISNLIDDATCTEEGESISWSGGVETCLKADILTDNKRKVIIDTVASINEYLSQLIKVTRLESPLSVQQKFDDVITKQTSVDADLFISVVARPYGEDSTTVASAMCFVQESTENRPVQGVVYVNVAKLPSKPETLHSSSRSFFETFYHEMVHAFGISGDMISEWLDPDTGKPYRQGGGTSKILKTITLPEFPNKHFNILHSPHCHQFAVDRFGLEMFTTTVPAGIEIEDGGGSGTAGSHPDARVYLDDVFVGFSLTETWITNLSLSMLADTGWYDIDFSFAEPSAWGYGPAYGQPLLTNFPLGAPPTTFPKNHLCQPEDIGFAQCSYDLMSGAACFGTYNNCSRPRTTEEQAFCDKVDFVDPGRTFMMGPTEEHDYVMVKSPFADVRCNAFAKNGEYAVVMKGEMYGGESLCALSTLMRFYLGYYEQPYPGCYRMDCNKDGSVEVYVDDAHKTCKKAGDKLIFYGFMGSITCPDPELVCNIKKFYGSTREDKLYVPKLIGLTPFWLLTIVLILLVVIIVGCTACCCVRRAKMKKLAAMLQNDAIMEEERQNMLREPMGNPADDPFAGERRHRSKSRSNRRKSHRSKHYEQYDNEEEDEVVSPYRRRSSSDRSEPNERKISKRRKSSSSSDWREPLSDRKKKRRRKSSSSSSSSRRSYSQSDYS